MENHNGYESASDLLARPRAASHEEKKKGSTLRNQPKMIWFCDVQFAGVT